MYILQMNQLRFTYTHACIRLRRWGPSRVRCLSSFKIRELHLKDKEERSQTTASGIQEEEPKLVHHATYLQQQAEKRGEATTANAACVMPDAGYAAKDADDLDVAAAAAAAVQVQHQTEISKRYRRKC